MKNENIYKVISEGAYRLHTGELERMKLRYSALEKSEPQLFGIDIREIPKLRLSREVKSEAIEAMGMIKAHEMYFSSFAKGICKCEKIKRNYSSENSFLYDVMRDALGYGEGFCFLMSRQNDVYHFLTKTPYEAFLNRMSVPVLALDLYEHAYFMDYGFEREEYIKHALSLWNLALIE